MVVVFWWPFRVFSKGGELGFPIFKNPNILILSSLTQLQSQQPHPQSVAMGGQRKGCGRGRGRPRVADKCGRRGPNVEAMRTKGFLAPVRAPFGHLFT